MMPNQNEQELRALFSQWLKGDGNETTIRRLSELAEDKELTGIFQSLLSGIPEESDNTTIQHTAILDKVYQKLIASDPSLLIPVRIRSIGHWMKYAAAVAIVLMVAGGYYFFNTQTEKKENTQLSKTSEETPAAPVNTNKATLTLSSGHQIILDASGNGMLAKQSGALVIKAKDGQIVYTKNDSLPTSDKTTDFNTVATPRGGEYKITLPDGTLVWLNAASSITFPTDFNGADRTVSVQGEVYLQVAKNASLPFRVKVNEAIIDVLGTEFNVNAYPDEAVTKTTLLTGSIRVTKDAVQKVLRPGQQVLFSESGNRLTVTDDIDTEQVIAWKNGNFDFRNQDIELVMNQLGRWYNMNIVYEGKKPAAKILGMMGRNMDLTTLLKSLELTSGIKFKVETSASKSQPGKIIVHQ